jgi:hypothetical protein
MLNLLLLLLLAGHRVHTKQENCAPHQLLMYHC